MQAGCAVNIRKEVVALKFIAKIPCSHESCDIIMGHEERGSAVFMVQNVTDVIQTT